MRWMDEPVSGLPRERANLGLLLAAWEVGSAVDADVFDHWARVRSVIRLLPPNLAGNAH